MDDATLDKFCACIDELGDAIDRLVQKVEENKELRVGALVVHKKHRWKSGRIISYNPETGVVIVRRGPGAFGAMEDEVEVIE